MLNNLNSGSGNTSNQSTQIEINKLKCEVNDLKTEVMDNSERIDSTEQRLDNLNNDVNTQRVTATNGSILNLETQTLSADKIYTDEIEGNLTLKGCLDVKDDLVVEGSTSLKDLNITGVMTGGNFCDATLNGNTNADNITVNNCVKSSCVDTNKLNATNATINTITAGTVNGNSADIDSITTKNITATGPNSNIKNLTVDNLNVTDSESDTLSTRFISTHCLDVDSHFHADHITFNGTLTLPTLDVDEWNVIHIPLADTGNIVFTNYNGHDSKYDADDYFAIEIVTAGHAIQINYGQTNVSKLKWFATNEETKELLIALYNKVPVINFGHSANKDIYPTIVKNEPTPSGPNDQVVLADKLDGTVFLFDGTTASGVYVNGILDAKYLCMGTGGVLDNLNVKYDLSAGDPTTNVGTTHFYKTMIVCDGANNVETRIVGNEINTGNVIATGNIAATNIDVANYLETQDATIKGIGTICGSLEVYGQAYGDTIHIHRTTPGGVVAGYYGLNASGQQSLYGEAGFNNGGQFIWFDMNACSHTAAALNVNQAWTGNQTFCCPVIVCQSGYSNGLTIKRNSNNSVGLQFCSNTKLLGTLGIGIDGTPYYSKLNGSVIPFLTPDVSNTFTATQTYQCPITVNYNSNKTLVQNNGLNMTVPTTGEWNGGLSYTNVDLSDTGWSIKANASNGQIKNVRVANPNGYTEFGNGYNEIRNTSVNKSLITTMLLNEAGTGISEYGINCIDNSTGNNDWLIKKCNGNTYFNNSCNWVCGENKAFYAKRDEAYWTGFVAENNCGKFSVEISGGGDKGSYDCTSGSTNGWIWRKGPDGYLHLGEATSVIYAHTAIYQTGGISGFSNGLWVGDNCTNITRISYTNGILNFTI